MNRQEKSTQAGAAFFKRVAELGGTVLEQGWLGANTRHRVRCAAGHEVAPLPTLVRDGGGICRVCSGRDPQAAWLAFQGRVAALGGVVLEPQWLGNEAPHRVRCAAGHDCSPCPKSIQRGQGICRKCAGRDPKAAEQAFRDRVAELGGTVLEPAWLGSAAPHRVRCAAGHENSTRPGDVRSGRGICRTCAGIDPRVAEREFHERVTALGGTVLEPTWLGANMPHRVRCAEGHETSPRPSNVRGRGSICRTCGGRDSVAAEKVFRDRIAKLGGVVLEPTWLGTSQPHRVLCAAGHESRPRPTHIIQRGGGVCVTCARKDPALAEREFRDRVTEQGGIVLEVEWRGANTPHRIRCAAGHESAPRPTGVQQGQGICRWCAGKEWDAFYVVVNDERSVVKFGITSGDPRPRLRRHARDGYKRVLRTFTGLPDGAARQLEQQVIAVLRLEGEIPVKGVEYYDARATKRVLEVVDGRLQQPELAGRARLPVPEQLSFEFKVAS